MISKYRTSFLIILGIAVFFFNDAAGLFSEITSRTLPCVLHCFINLHFGEKIKLNFPVSRKKWFLNTELNTHFFWIFITNCMHHSVYVLFLSTFSKLSRNSIEILYETPTWSLLLCLDIIMFLKLCLFPGNLLIWEIENNHVVVGLNVLK